MKWLEIIVVKSTIGTNLLKRIVRRLGIRKTDRLPGIRTPIEVENASEPDFAEQLDIAEDVMHEWRDLLRKLGE